jgi:hypothetical protein
LDTEEGIGLAVAETSAESCIAALRNAALGETLPGSRNPAELSGRQDAAKPISAREPNDGLGRIAAPSWINS